MPNAQTRGAIITIAVPFKFGEGQPGQLGFWADACDAGSHAFCPARKVVGCFSALIINLSLNSTTSHSCPELLLVFTSLPAHHHAVYILPCSSTRTPSADPIDLDLASQSSVSLHTRFASASSDIINHRHPGRLLLHVQALRHLVDYTPDPVSGSSLSQEALLVIWTHSVSVCSAQARLQAALQLPP